MHERFHNEFNEHQLHQQLVKAIAEDPHAAFGDLRGGRGIYQPEKTESTNETVTEAATEPRHLTLVPPVANVEQVPESVPAAEREQHSA